MEEHGAHLDVERWGTLDFEGAVLVVSQSEQDGWPRERIGVPASLGAEVQLKGRPREGDVEPRCGPAHEPVQRLAKLRVMVRAVVDEMRADGTLDGSQDECAPSQMRGARLVGDHVCEHGHSRVRELARERDRSSVSCRSRRGCAPVEEVGLSDDLASGSSACLLIASERRQLCRGGPGRCCRQ